jgi:hypothetical protein
MLYSGAFKFKKANQRLYSEIAAFNWAFKINCSYSILYTADGKSGSCNGDAFASNCGVMIDINIPA